MSQCVRQKNFSPRLNRRQDKRLRLLSRLERMRAAKEQHRQERIEAGWEPEPRMERWFPIQLGVRDKRTGEVAWVDFMSLPDAMRRLACVARHYSV